MSAPLTDGDYTGLIAVMVPLDGIEEDIEHMWTVNRGLGHRLPRLFYVTTISAVHFGLSKLVQGIWQGGRLSGDESDRVRSYLLSMRDDARLMINSVGAATSYPGVGKIATKSVLTGVFGSQWHWPIDPSDPFYAGDVRWRMPWREIPVTL